MVAGHVEQDFFSDKPLAHQKNPAQSRKHLFQLSEQHLHRIHLFVPRSQRTHRTPSPWTHMTPFDPQEKVSGLEEAPR